MANEKRLIDANALIEKKRQFCCGHGEYDYMVELCHIENAPTVDAVEVVRCKDCKWWENGKDFKPYCNHWKSGLYDVANADDFCSYGERRTE